MRILVTGRSGQLGRALGEAAEAARGRGGGAAWDGLILTGREELDLAVPETIAPALARHAPDVVINAAAYTAVDKAEDEAELAFKVNGEGAGVLAREVAGRGGRLIHVSTDYVFDGTKDGPYLEDDRIAPQSAYGRSKAAGEAAVRAAGRGHVIVRTAWVYSAFGHNFVKTMLRLAETRDEVRVVADQWGSPTSAHDLARGLLAVCQAWAVEPGRGLGETFHLAGAGEAHWADVARQVFAASGEVGGPVARVSDITSDQWPAKAPRPANSRLCSEKFARAFGFQMPEWRQSLVTTTVRIVREKAL